MTQRTRLDKLLLERALVPSRERAQSLILAGRVLVNEQKVTKAGAAIDRGAVVRVLGDNLRYVSRGGLKLERALQHWHIDISGLFCMDVGASTGGFTDCMLQHGAAQVLAIDTGYGQIDARLRSDPRVHLLERTNARYVAAEQVETRIDFVSMDVSFISATLVLPAVIAAAFRGHGGKVVILVKPQFEVGRENVGKGGIVRDEVAQQRAVERVRAKVLELGARSVDVVDSPILGAEGNKEFLLYAQF